MHEDVHPFKEINRVSLPRDGYEYGTVLCDNQNEETKHNEDCLYGVLLTYSNSEKPYKLVKFDLASSTKEDGKLTHKTSRPQIWDDLINSLLTKSNTIIMIHHRAVTVHNGDDIEDIKKIDHRTVHRYISNIFGG